MRLQVREMGNEVHIELTGVAGRHQRVLEALTECQRAGKACTGSDQPCLDPADVSVRAGSNEMHIRLKGQGSARIEPASIYRCLRRALFEHVEAAQSAAPVAL